LALLVLDAEALPSGADVVAGGVVGTPISMLPPVPCVDVLLDVAELVGLVVVVLPARPLMLVVASTIAKLSLVLGCVVLTTLGTLGSTEPVEALVALPATTSVLSGSVCPLQAVDATRFANTTN
jgi:hypothetical protein